MSKMFAGKDLERYSIDCTISRPDDSYYGCFSPPPAPTNPTRSGGRSAALSEAELIASRQT